MAMQLKCFMRPALCGAMGLVLALAAFSAVASDNPKVRLKTDLGPIVLELFPEHAPATVENFLTYVDNKFYDGTIFHRVIPGFVAQGGGMTYDFTRKKTRDPVVNESDNGLKNSPMTIAMARHSDPDSATSQFFINLNHNPSLNATEDRPGYTVFGRVIEGFETVVKIVEEPRGDYSSYPEAPNTPVRVLSAERVSASESKRATEKESDQGQ